MASLREAEKQLIRQIKDYRQELRESLRKEFLQERQRRHAKGEVYIRGVWASRELVPAIRKKLQHNGLVQFFEIHLLVGFILFGNYLFWRLFVRILLP